MIINILIIAVIIAYVLANIIQAIVAVDQNDTFEEILSYSQDTKLGRFLMTIFYFPVLVFLKIRSLRRVDTSFSFEDKEDNYEY